MKLKDFIGYRKDTLNEMKNVFISKIARQMLLLQNKNQKSITMIFQLIEINWNMMLLTFSFFKKSYKFSTFLVTVDNILWLSSSKNEHLLVLSSILTIQWSSLSHLKFHLPLHRHHYHHLKFLVQSCFHLKRR